jgi:hypothetical protein
MQPILDAILKHVTMMMMMMRMMTLLLLLLLFMLLLLLLLLFMLVVLDSTAERRRQRSVCLICHKVSKRVCDNRITCYNYYCSCYYYYYDYDYYYYCYLSPLLLSMKHCEPRDFRPHRHRPRGTGHHRNRRSDQIDRHRS